MTTEREGELSTEGGRPAGKDPLIGTTLDGRFEVKRMIARGGMGKIYEAIQQPLGRTVAIKVMDLGYSAELDPDFAKRFFLEASTSARLSHPNTIRIFDYGQVGDVYYIVMELLVGETLLSLINREAPLPPLRVIHICRQIGSSLAEAHKMGIVHRDLKPSNVVLTKHGENADYAKVLDFGLAKLLQGEGEITRSGLFLGSPNYMSPEQIRSNQVDQRSDIYSLGVLLFMCLTGRSPFKRETQVNILVAQLEDDPPEFADLMGPPLPPTALEWIVKTCLRKKADERFATVGELNTALKAVELELRGQLPSVELSLDRGRTVLPAAAVALLTESYEGRSGAGSIDAVTTGGSLVADRVRREPTPAQDERTAPAPTPTPAPPIPAQPTANTRARRRRPPPPPPKPNRLPLALAGMAFLGAVVALVLVLGRRGPTEAPPQLAAPPELPLIEPDPSLPPELPVEPVVVAPATPAPTPRAVRARTPRPSAAPAARAPEPAAASTPAPVVVQTVQETPPPPAKATPTPAPPPATQGSDLRDPWAD